MNSDRIEAIDREIEALDVQINILLEKREKLQLEKESLLEKQSIARTNDHQDDIPDYASENFTWSTELRSLAARHWGIREFRPLQLPIMNAALDRQRDIFVVLPTGGGKSLCYQLPALIDNGFTLVVSPLVSLIQDQVYHLLEANIPAAFLTAASSKEQVNEVQDCMSPRKGHEKDRKDFKLIYVTPEKIAKSKRFMSKLTQAHEEGRLARIVIDEAHCCSQQGHDFRPDYKALNVLRTVFPKVPIMALTATCPWSVMKDVMYILGMKKPQLPGGTLVYSAPLYRPNLIYKVLPKPDTQEEHLKHMAEWILERYPGSSGIVYCLTKKDTETVCQGLYNESRGRIRCAIYHADMESDEKEYVHTQWRENKIQVIVATVAFGMGINHLQTRYVIHHTMSKSIENYYQESGRAGRDGKDAECVLYYRGQDAARISAMIVGEVQGGTNLYNMIRYAQNYNTCRKIIFENYFVYDASVSAATSMANKLVNETTPDTRCGKCDNCVRNQSEVVKQDITKEARTVVLLSQALKQMRERVTMLKLIQLWRGKALAGAKVASIKQNPDAVIPVDKKFTNMDLERIINHLLVEGYLGEDFHFTPYSSISYVVPGSKAELLKSKAPVKIELEFIRNAPVTSKPTKRKRPRLVLSDTDEDDIEDDDEQAKLQPRKQQQLTRDIIVLD